KNGGTVAMYTYDAHGNPPTPNATPASYDGQDRLPVPRSAPYGFTPHGGVAAKTASRQDPTSTYDTPGTLRSTHLTHAPRVDYLVDGLNRRIGKRVNGTLVQGFLYDERGRVVAELDGSSALVSRFVYASRPNVPDYLVRGGVEYRIVSDDLGSVRLVIKADD